MNVLSQEGGEAVRSCAFSPNGSYIISSDDSGTICVWGQNRNLLKVIRCHEEAVHTIAFSPDSSVLLTGCSLGNVRLFSFNENYDGKSILFLQFSFQIYFNGFSYCIRSCQ